MECGSRVSSCVINMSPLELEVMAAACTLGPSAFLRPLVALISFEIPQPLGSAPQLFPFSACSFPDGEIRRGSVTGQRPTAG